MQPDTLGRAEPVHMPLEHTTGPRQVPGAADIHKGTRGPIWPAGVVIKGSVAEETCGQEWRFREETLALVPILSPFLHCL